MKRILAIALAALTLFSAAVSAQDALEKNNSGYLLRSSKSRLRHIQSQDGVKVDSKRQ